MKGASWMAGARVLTNLIGFASTIILARLLVPDDFGIVAIAEAIALIVTSVTELSLANALIQHKSPGRDHYDSAFTLNALRSALLALVILAIAFPASGIYGDERLVPVLGVIALATVVGGLENPRLVALRRQLIFRQDFLLPFVAKLAGFVVAVGIAVAFRSYWALVLGSLASQAVRVALSYAVIPYLPRARLNRWRELLSFSGWLTLSRGVRTLNLRSDPIALGFFVGAAGLGNYALGSRLAYLPVFEALSPLRQILFPAFSRMNTDPARLRSAYLRAQRLLLFCGIPIAVGFAAVAEPAIVLLIGEKWRPIVPIIEVLALVSILGLLESSEPLAMALGRTKDIASRDVRVALIRLPFLALGLIVGISTPLGPIMGVVYARGAALAINLWLNAALVRDLSGIGIARQFRPALRPLLAAGAMAGAVLAATAGWAPVEGGAEPFLILAGAVLLGAVIYVLAAGLLWLAWGRPEGAEREVLDLARPLARRLFDRPRQAGRKSES
ncbi:MAG: lipopolysaccharide biosynthesis protein [Erythrobacter sp.]|nr:lipopolysaccharide biosynthesis protein [Erythrobacter sp.]